LQDIRCNLRGSSLVKYNINKGEEEEAETGDSSLESEMKKEKTTLLLGEEAYLRGHWSILAKDWHDNPNRFSFRRRFSYSSGRYSRPCLRIVVSGDKSRRRIGNGRRRKSSVVKTS